MESFIAIQVATRDALAAISKLQTALLSLESDPKRLIEPGRAHYTVQKMCPELSRNLYEIQHRLDNKRSGHEWRQIEDESDESPSEKLAREDLNWLERRSSISSSPAQPSSADSSRRVSGAATSKDWLTTFASHTGGAAPKDPEFTTVEEATAAFEKLSKWNHDVFDECLALREEYDEFRELNSKALEKVLDQLNVKVELHAKKKELKATQEELRQVREELEVAQLPQQLARTDTSGRALKRWLSLRGLRRVSL